eukprot:TRINITY_DN1653_c0_g1_i10.p1 TRINITY_DN1653_c0_g1~~TRINITY_DN1653_c0_g1_i10.p1  ORF type:complete len:105 (+),score=15.99 TRINITY_DN1653_c0_g1_i10:634-948(+)
MVSCCGNAWGQYNLGNCYARGKGVSQDVQVAAKWFGLSAAQGNKTAQRELQPQLQTDSKTSNLPYTLGALHPKRRQIYSREICSKLANLFLLVLLLCLIFNVIW